jgi:8-oxo-dGTP pyrophosphatase MutT (NUDIX family)
VSDPANLKPWALVSDRTVCQTPVLKVLARTLVSPKDGRPKDFTVLDAPSWVNVLAITPDERAVLVSQYRFGSQSFSLELPGGAVDPGEDPKDAARRELLEETGYSAPAFSLFLSLNPNPALFGNAVMTFVAQGAVLSGPTRFDENEETAVRLVDLPALRAKTLSGEIRHALMLAPLLRFFLERPDL